MSFIPFIFFVFYLEQFGGHYRMESLCGRYIMETPELGIVCSSSNVINAKTYLRELHLLCAVTSNIHSLSTMMKCIAVRSWGSNFHLMLIVFGNYVGKMFNASIFCSWEQLSSFRNHCQMINSKIYGSMWFTRFVAESQRLQLISLCSFTTLFI